MKFRTKLQTVGQTVRKMDSAFLIVPFDVEKTFGRKGRIPVAGTIDSVPFRSSIFPAMGMLKQAGLAGKHFMVVNREIREALGKQAGDTVTVVMEPDTKARSVTLPKDFKQELQSRGLLEGFQKLPYTHKKESVQWISEAKKPETRARRLAKALAMIAGKVVSLKYHD